MTEQQWRSLKPGDVIVNKRSPAGQLKVLAAQSGGTGIFRVRFQRATDGEEFENTDWLQYALLLPQERMPL